MTHSFTCKLCGKTYTTKSFENYNLGTYSHLKNNHPKEYADLKKAYSNYKTMRVLYGFDSSLDGAFKW